MKNITAYLKLIVARFACLLALGTLFITPPARAEVPEPDNVIYGVVTLGITPVTALQTNVIVEARKTANGPVVASYRMGENPGYGNAYSLEVPLEAFFPLTDTNASRVGALVYLSVRDNSGVRDSRTISIAQRGQFVRVDFAELDSDGDGIPDRWEQQYFGSTTGGDPTADGDGDGRNNLQEFIDGTNPLVADGRHPADSAPANNLLTFEEADAYANAWLVGTPWPAAPTNIPISYVSRAAALAVSGGPYTFTNSRATNAPLWWVNLPYPGPRAPGINQAACLTLPANPASNAVFTVTLRITPTNSAIAYAVQDHPPAGWNTVQNISHGGSYDAVNRQVKWGPFYDNGPRDLYYDLLRPGSATGTNTFAGIASFDGFDVIVAGARSIVIGTNGSTDVTLARWTSSSVVANQFTFRLSGAPATSYVIETSTNLTTWQAVQTNTTDAAGTYLFQPLNPGAGRRFYRARN